MFTSYKMMVSSLVLSIGIMVNSHPIIVPAGVVGRVVPGAFSVAEPVVKRNIARIPQWELRGGIPAHLAAILLTGYGAKQPLAYDVDADKFGINHKYLSPELQEILKNRLEFITVAAANQPNAAGIVVETPGDMYQNYDAMKMSLNNPELQKNTVSFHPTDFASAEKAKQGGYGKVVKVLLFGGLIKLSLAVGVAGMYMYDYFNTPVAPILPDEFVKNVQPVAVSKLEKVKALLPELTRKNVAQATAVVATVAVVTYALTKLYAKPTFDALVQQYVYDSQETDIKVIEQQFYQALAKHGYVSVQDQQRAAEILNDIKLLM